MAGKNVDIRINTTADTTGAKQATAAMQGLAASTQQAAAQSQAVTASAGKLGQTAGQIGLQLQDVAVQAQSGTSAVTILAQQGTQIASIFGPQGAIVGAIIGVGAVAAKVFYDMAVAAAVTGEAMEDMSDKLKEAFGDQAKQLVSDFNQQLQNQAKTAQSLRESEINLAEARMQREQADQAVISSQAQLETAAVKYLDATGQIINAEKALAKIRNDEAEAQRAAQVAEIEGQVQVARARYNAITQQYNDAQEQADAAQARLIELEARQQQVMSDLTFSRGQDVGARKFGLLGKDESSLKTNALQGELDALKTQIEGVYDIIKQTPQRLEEANQTALQAAVELDIALTTAEGEIASINEQFNLAQSAEQITTATKEITEGAKEIQQVVAGFEAVTPAQEAAKASILQAVKDGEITAQEQQQIGQNLTMLLTSLRTGQGEQSTAIRQLIELNNNFTLQMQSANNEIRALRARVQALQGIR